MRYFILAALLVSSSAHALKVEDIEVIDLVLDEPSVFQFKVKSKSAAPNSFFYLAFDKNKTDNLDKMTFILLKLIKQNQYVIDLDIPNFSSFPSGSYYSSSDIHFYKRQTRAPNQVLAPKGGSRGK